MNRKALITSRNRDTARISSGTTNENIIRKFCVEVAGPRRPCSARAKATPSGNVTTTVRDASFRLWITACWSAGSCRTDPVGSEMYQRSENPSHCVIDRPLLNENSTASATGNRVQAT